MFIYLLNFRPLPNLKIEIIGDMEPKDILILLEKLQRNTITDAELELVKKIFQDASNRKELISLMRQSYDRQMRNHSNLSAYENQDEVRRRLIESIQPASIFKRRSFYYQVAAVLAVLFLIGGLFYYTQRTSPENTIVFTSVSTKAGERKKVILKDGSTILLNGCSRLSYPIHSTTNFRMVKLEGEAFFEITTDRQKPFLVVSDRFTTQVVGTSFNIETDNNHTVQVNTGKVNVYTVDNQHVLRALENNRSEGNKVTENIMGLATAKISLIRGEKADLNAKGSWEPSHYSLKNWKDNELIYLNEPIEKVVRNVYRNFGDSIQVDPSFHSQKITITLRNKNNLQILNTLAELCNGKLILNKEKNIWQITKH